MMSIGKNLNAISNMYCLCVNLTMKMSLRHMVEHPDKRTQVLCEVCVCCSCSALPRVSHTPRVISGCSTICTTQVDRQTHAAAAFMPSSSTKCTTEGVRK